MNLSDETRRWAEQTREKMTVKFRAEAERVGSALPFIPVQGHYRDCMMPGGAGWWTNGFWPGILWQMEALTKDSVFRRGPAHRDHPGRSRQAGPRRGLPLPAGIARGIPVDRQPYGL